MAVSNNTWTVCIEQYEGICGVAELVSVSTAYFYSYDEAVTFWESMDSRRLPPLDDEDAYLIVLYSPESKHLRSKG